MEIKQSTSFRVPVRLLEPSTGLGKTGVAFGSVACKLQKQAGSSATKSIITSDWFEVDSSGMPGVYDLLLSTTDTNTVGFLKYGITVTNAEVYIGVVDIVTNLESDTFARIGAPIGASISADIVALQADLDNIQTRLPTSLVSGRIDASVGAMAADTITAAVIATDAIGAVELAASAVTEIQTGLATAAALASVASDALQARRIAEGRWKIDSTAKTFTVYDSNGTTPLVVYDLKDAAGLATATTIFERVPV